MIKVIPSSYGDTVRIISRPVQFPVAGKDYSVPGYSVYAARTRAGIRIGASVVTLALPEAPTIAIAVDWAIPNDAYRC